MSLLVGSEALADAFNYQTIFSELIESIEKEIGQVSLEDLLQQVEKFGEVPLLPETNLAQFDLKPSQNGNNSSVSPKKEDNSGNLNSKLLLAKKEESKNWYF